jgi:hypothetical protein
VTVHSLLTLNSNNNINISGNFSVRMSGGGGRANKFEKFQAILSTFRFFKKQTKKRQTKTCKILESSFWEKSNSGKREKEEGEKTLLIVDTLVPCIARKLVGPIMDILYYSCPIYIPKVSPIKFSYPHDLQL